MAQLATTPPAKRARVSGTLDAFSSAHPSNGGAGPDLSEATLQRYRDCAHEVGVRLIAATGVTARTGDAQKDFMEDLLRYMRDINAEVKIRTIGGNKLDLYTLYVSVLERGGVQAVISTRTFRLIAKALNLPPSCTSAAFILRSDYEKMLYAYEQKHVWGRNATNLPTLYMTERVSRSSAAFAAAHTPNSAKSRPRSSGVSARGGSTSAIVLATPGTSARPKRQAALAASSAVAAAAAAHEDDYGSPELGPRRTRTMGIDEAALTPTEEAIVEEEVNANAPHTVYIPGQTGERERVIGALWSTVHDDVAFALGTLNALSFDPRNTFQARSFPGLLDALYELMHRHLQDVIRSRAFGLPCGAEEVDPQAPHISSMTAADVADAGDACGSVGLGGSSESTVRSSSLQLYNNLFNVVDSVAVDREQCAVVAVNILRNMSFSDRNAIFLSEARNILELSAEMIMTVKVPANLRDGLIDVWINVSPYLNVSKGYPGHIVLTTCIKLLNPFLEGADFTRFTNAGEILARLAASPERNEEAVVGEFNELLPRLVDMLGGKDRRYVNTGLAALCNCSAFDWPARSRIARVPRAMPRLVNMLTDAELAPRAALTLLNLAEAPSNRSVLLSYEKQLVEQAIKVSPASDTVASVLYDLSND